MNTTLHATGKEAVAYFIEDDDLTGHPDTGWAIIEAKPRKVVVVVVVPVLCSCCGSCPAAEPCIGRCINLDNHLGTAGLLHWHLTP